MSKRRLPEGEATERVARQASRRDAPPAAVRDLTGEQVDPRRRRKVEKATVDSLYDNVKIPLAEAAAGGARTAAAGAAAAGAAAAGANAEAEPLRYRQISSVCSRRRRRAEASASGFLFMVTR